MEPLAQLLALELDYNALPDADLAARRTALVDALDEASREPNPSSQFAGLAAAAAAQVGEIDTQIAKRAALATSALVARQMNDPALEQEWVRQNNLAYGGLIGVALVMVQPLVTAARLDVSAKISVVSFAVSDSAVGRSRVSCPPGGVSTTSDEIGSRSCCEVCCTGFRVHRGRRRVLAHHLDRRSSDARRRLRRSRCPLGWLHTSRTGGFESVVAISAESVAALSCRTSRPEQAIARREPDARVVTPDPDAAPRAVRLWRTSLGRGDAARHRWAPPRLSEGSLVRIIMVGGTGTIGRAVVDLLSGRHDVVVTGRQSGDVQVDISSRDSVRSMYHRIGSFDAVE